MKTLRVLPGFIFRFHIILYVPLAVMLVIKLLPQNQNMNPVYRYKFLILFSIYRLNFLKFDKNEGNMRLKTKFLSANNFENLKPIQDQVAFFDLIKSGNNSCHKIINFRHLLTLCGR